MAKEISILLTAKDLASGNIRKVSGELGGLNRRGKLAAVGLGSAGLAANKAAPAMRHFGSTVKGLAGGVGFLGVTLGATGLAGAFGSAIARGTEFAKTSSSLASFLHMNVGEASALADTLDDFGLAGDQAITVIGRLNKNADSLAGTTKKAQKFQKDFGFSLTGTNGKVADSNTLLQRAADYYTSSASASQKATVMNKLFGKSWTQLIPLLKLGGKGVKDYTANSIHLTKEQVKAAAAFEPLKREFASLIDEIKIMVGLDVLPDVTVALRKGVHWLKGHKDEVRGWFKQGFEGAKQLVGFITGTVIPTLAKIAGTAKAAWSGIPDPIKDLLVKGTVADRTIKFLFGISPGEMLFKGLGGAIASAIGGKLFQRGGSPASPLFVSPVGAGMGGTGGTGIIAKGSSALSKVVSIGAIVGSALGVFETWQQVNQSSTQQATEVQQQANKWLASQPKRQDLITGLAGVEQGIADIRSNPLNVLVSGDALAKLEAMRSDIRAQLGKLDANTATGRSIISAVQGVGPAVSNALGKGNIVGAILALIPHIDAINLRVNGAGVSRTGQSQRAHAGTARSSGAPGSNLPGYSPPTRHGGGRAKGGPVKPGTSYRIGEKGPETFVPTTGGTILPNGKAKAGMPVYVTNWPKGGGTGISGSEGDIGSSGAWHVTRVNRDSPRHDALLHPVHVTVRAHSSAREAHKAHAHWRRYGGNGAAVSLD